MKDSTKLLQDTRVFYLRQPTELTLQQGGKKSKEPERRFIAEIPRGAIFLMEDKLNPANVVVTGVFCAPEDSFDPLKAYEKAMHRLHIANINLRARENTIRTVTIKKEALKTMSFTQLLVHIWGPSSKTKFAQVRTQVDNDFNRDRWTKFAKALDKVLKVGRQVSKRILAHFQS